MQLYHRARVASPWILASIAFSLFLLPASLSQQDRDEVFSENKKFAAEITETEINQPTITIFKVENEVRTLLWNRKLITAEEANDPAFSENSYMHGFDNLVSNDGAIVVMLARHSYDDEQLGLRVLTKGGADWKFLNFELLDPVWDLLTAEIHYYSEWHLLGHCVIPCEMFG